jgi:hypothetical protein
MGMGQTSIPCDSETRDRLAADKPEDVSWSAYLRALHDGTDISTSGVDESEIARRVTEDVVSQVPEQVADELEGRLR